MIHPAAWREAGGHYKKIQDIMRGIDIKWLSIHNYSDGQKNFGAGTRYDMYVAENSCSGDCITDVVDEKGQPASVNIKSMKFVPNFDIEAVNSLIAKDREKCVDLMFDRSMYGTDKIWMSSEKKGKFQLPCVYYSKKTTKKTRYFYSNERKGHFGIPKVIFGCNGNVGNIICDYDGKYGLTQFVAGIADKPEYLDDIKAAMESERFKSLMEAVQFGKPQYNRRVIAFFRKNFWRKFV